MHATQWSGLSNGGAIIRKTLPQQLRNAVPIKLDIIRT